MSDTRACSGCGFVNAPGAEACAECGRLFAASETRLHPGETLRDPDDLTLPDSALLRAVVRGTPESGIHPPAARPLPPAPRPLPKAVRSLRADVDQSAALRDLAEWL